MFLSPDKLPSNKMDLILLELNTIIGRSSAQKENVKLTSFGFSVAKKSEVQDLLDSILKIAYPYISQARGLTDMHKELEYSRPGAGLKFSLLPEALPVGHEDKTPVILGLQKDEQDIKSVVKVYVWRGKQCVWYQHEGDAFYKPIISETEPVDMEDAQSVPVAVNFSATGKGGGWSYLLGDLTLTGELLNDRPVYRSSKDYYLYSLESGAWGVRSILGSSKPLYRSTTPALSPALCQEWEYREALGSEYKPGEISVTVPPIMLN